jgi:uncharacterized ion transporter superfamily protein YfcC
LPPPKLFTKVDPLLTYLLSLVAFVSILIYLIFVIDYARKVKPDYAKMDAINNSRRRFTNKYSEIDLKFYMNGEKHGEFVQNNTEVAITTNSSFHI